MDTHSFNEGDRVIITNPNAMSQQPESLPVKGDEYLVEEADNEYVTIRLVRDGARNLLGVRAKDAHAVMEKKLAA